MPSPEVTIIGVGGLGKSLARALLEANIPVKSLFNRTVDKAQNLAADLNISIAGSFPEKIGHLGNLIFITVADDALKEVSERLGSITDDFSGRTVVHCSGNESAELLDDLKSKGAATASFHPLQTFTDQSNPATFEDIFFSLQGDESAFSDLKQIAQKLGAQTLEVNAEQKSHLHAAAVLASNYLNTLLNASVETASLSGLPSNKVKQALLPLVKTTLQNIEHQSFKKALSGPIKRGDVATVEKHLKLLQDQPDLLNLYRELGYKTIKLAQRSQSIDDVTAQKMLNLLE